MLNLNGFIIILIFKIYYRYRNDLIIKIGNRQEDIIIDVQ